jgi:hypothetical protein
VSKQDSYVVKVAQNARRQFDRRKSGSGAEVCRGRFRVSQAAGRRQPFRKKVSFGFAFGNKSPQLPALHS